MSTDLAAEARRVTDLCRRAREVAEGSVPPGRRAAFFTRKAELLDDMGLCDLAVVARQKAAS